MKSSNKNVNEDGCNRRIFERQYSDKYLKRRTQIITVEQHQHQKHQQRYNDHHRRRHCQYHDNYHDKNNNVNCLYIVIFVSFVIIISSYYVSPPTNNNNNNNNDNNNNNFKNNSTLSSTARSANSKDVATGSSSSHSRSYQDLANSIRMVRRRRHEEKFTNNKDRVNDGDSKDTINIDEDGLRLEHLEEKILLDQSRKVKREHDGEQSKLTTSNNNKDNNKNNNSNKLDSIMVDTIAALKLHKSNDNEKNNDK